MIKTIVVDDEYLIRERIKACINSIDSDYEIAGEAADGEDALKLVEELSPQLALVDINMPIIDGLCFAKEVRQKHPELKIVMLTGYSSFEYAREAIRCSVQNYLLKPLNKDELRECLTEIKNQIEKEEATIVKNKIIVGRNNNCSNIKSKSHELVENAKKFIEDNYSNEELCLDDIANSVFLNACYLSNIFKKETGFSVTEFLRDCRMKKAKELIERDGESIYNISNLVGFSDQHYFSKCFKKYFGISPSRYIELQKQQ